MRLVVEYSKKKRREGYLYLLLLKDTTQNLNRTGNVMMMQITKLSMVLGNENRLRLELFLPVVNE